MAEEKAPEVDKTTVTVTEEHSAPDPVPSLDQIKTKLAEGGTKLPESSYIVVEKADEKSE